MRKKGQAAMEFLMTYGWAILAAVIVIGVLWYLIGDPSNLIGNRLTVTPPFVQNALAIDTEGVTMEVINGAGESIAVSNVNVTSCGSNSTVLEIADGSTQVLFVTCSLTSGNNFNGDLTITYNTTGSSVNQKATGTVKGQVA